MNADYGKPADENSVCAGSSPHANQVTKLGMSAERLEDFPLQNVNYGERN